MRLLLILANVLLLAFMVGLYLLIEWRGLEFALGFLTAVLLFQVAYRLRHGYWFDIEPPDNTL